MRICIEFFLFKRKHVFLHLNRRGMTLSNSELVQYLADGFTVLEISKITGNNKRAIEKRILTIKKIALSKNSCNLVANYMRKRLIE